MQTAAKRKSALFPKPNMIFNILNNNRPPQKTAFNAGPVSSAAMYKRSCCPLWGDTWAQAARLFAGKARDRAAEILLY